MTKFTNHCKTVRFLLDYFEEEDDFPVVRVVDVFVTNLVRNHSTMNLGMPLSVSRRLT